MSVDTVDNAFIERRRKHDRRVAASRRIRDARQKLASTSTTARPEFHYDLLYMCARNETGAALATPILATIVALASFYWTFSTSIVLWLASVFITESALLMLCRRFLNEQPGETSLATWRTRLTLAAFFNGIAWGAITISIGQYGEYTADIIIFATLIVILGIRTMFASTLLSFIYASTIPMTVALVTRFVLADTELNWVMAIMAVCVHAYFIFLSRSLNDTVLSMLGLKAEKDALIAEIEEAKAISDEARLRAESANLAKSRFLATMSHELRTPLNAILGFSEMLKTELFGPHSNPIYKEYAKDIHVSGEHLLNVINDILDISRIEADRYELKEEAVPLSSVAQDCIRLLRVRADNKGLQIKTNIAEDLPKLWAEEKATRQVILNLLSNAIKFTPQGGVITVDIGINEDADQFVSIEDNGPGIPKDEIKKVLTPFGQGSLAHETAEGGTGLGLPIVKRLMEIHGGSFVLESELRRGTKVVATFPSKRSMKALPPVPDAKAKHETQTKPDAKRVSSNKATQQNSEKPGTQKIDKSPIASTKHLTRESIRLNALTGGDTTSTKNKNDGREQLRELAKALRAEREKSGAKTESIPQVETLLDGKTDTQKAS